MTYILLFFFSMHHIYIVYTFNMLNNNLFVSTHAEIIVHSYKSGRSILTNIGQSILVRMYNYFRVIGDKQTTAWMVAADQRTIFI